MNLRQHFLGVSFRGRSLPEESGRTLLRALRAPASALSVLSLFLVLAPTSAPASQCTCSKPEKGDVTRWGGNEAVVIVPEKRFREIKGTVETLQDEKMVGALAGVFDKPDYLVSNKPGAEKPEQKRLRSCVTAPDGKFCFRSLPSGTYEVRISKDKGWNVSHVYIVVDRKAAEKIEPLHIAMHIGT